MLCLFLYGQRLLDLGDDAVGIDAVGVEHQRGLAAAAELVVDAVADDGHGVILAQIFGDCRAKTAEDVGLFGGDDRAGFLRGLDRKSVV